MLPISSQIEFYRNRTLELESSGYEMKLLAHMPGAELAWYCDLLLLMGDLLISSGTKLKDSAHPVTILSKETL